MKRVKYLGFILIVFLSLALATGSFKYNFSNVSAVTLEELNRQIEEYEREISRLKTQANTLSNQIAQFNAQIRLTTLKILETQEKILMLGGRIDQLEVSLEVLTDAFSTRAAETYKMARLGDPLIFLISAKDLSEAVSRFHYLKKIQEADRDLLTRLEKAQGIYREEKQDEEDLQDQLEEQNRILGVQRAAKANLLAVTKNDEQKYQTLLARAVAQKAAFLRFVSGEGGATILENQTKCDSWGCYYNQRDSEWGRNSLGTSGLSVAGYGCLVSSVSMIASHHGINIKPPDIAANPGAFVGDTAYLMDKFSVNGVNVTKQHVSRSLLDSELNAGRPVIVGLYSGPDHFIVIKGKSGDDYIMHDPFLENGGNRLFSEKYNVSNINSLRLISFN